MAPEWIPLLTFPIEWAALALFVAGVIYAERSGYTGLLIEGSVGCAMLGFILGYEATGHYAVAAAAAAAGALAFAVVAATLIRVFGADPMVGGFTLSLVAASALGLTTRFGSPRLLADRPPPGLTPETVFAGTHAEDLLASPWFWSAPALLALAWWILWRTPLGLRFRASGEQPTLRVRGVGAAAHRLIGLAIGALLVVPGAGLLLRAYPDAPPAGLGYLALACVIAGRWAFLPALLLAAGPALLRTARPYGEALGGWSIGLEMTPYLLGALYLVLFSRRSLRFFATRAARVDPDTL